MVPVIASQTVYPFFTRRIFGELSIAKNALQVIIIILSFLEMWLCLPEASLESLPLSPKRGRETVPFLIG
jgi:hypothetical protein